MSNKKIHFEISERKILLRLFDVLLVFLTLHVFSHIFSFDYFNISTSNYYWLIVLGIYINVFGSVFEMYNLQISSNQIQIVRSIILTTSVTVLFYLLTPIFAPALPTNRLQILFFYIAVFLALFVWRQIYARFLASKRFSKKVIIVCDIEQVDELVSGIENIDFHFEIIGFVNTDSKTNLDYCYSHIKNIEIDNLKEFVKQNSVSEIIIASQKTDGITTNLFNQLISLLEKGYIIKEYTQVYENMNLRIPMQFLSRDFYKFFPFSRNNSNKLYLSSTRFFDVLIALIGILTGILFIPFIIIFNFFGNKGKLFYTQKRIGKNGKKFKIIKFRTMVENAETDKAIFATTNDSRITPFGKFLRKSRIDEFPQFINILKGQMSVIGPRPERPVFVKQISEIMPFYESRHVLKPGLTGWAQVNYSYGESINDSLIKLQYDLYYIKHRSVFLDISIMFKTISTVLFYRGQ